MIRPQFAALVGFLLIATGAPTAQAPPPAPAVPSSAGNGVPGRHPEEGRPFIRTYGPSTSNAAGQNWAIVQDARGVIYVGSKSGRARVRRRHWRLIETPTLEHRAIAGHRRRRTHLRRQRSASSATSRRTPRASCGTCRSAIACRKTRGRSPTSGGRSSRRRRGVPDRAAPSSAGRTTPSTVIRPTSRFNRARWSTAGSTSPCPRPG